MRPPAILKLSLNFKVAPNRAISCIVLHATATPGIESPLSWLCDPKSQVSAHYLLGRDGKLYQLVAERDIAWHAGKSSWRGKDGVNAFSVGIELVNANDGKQEYPPAQIDVCAALVTELCRGYGIKVVDVISHADIAPGRKNDPLGFPWDEFRAKLKQGGIT